MEDNVDTFRLRSADRDARVVHSFNTLIAQESAVTPDEGGEAHVRTLLGLCGQVVAQRAEESAHVLQSTESVLKRWSHLCQSANSPQIREVPKLRILFLTLRADYHKSCGRPKPALKTMKQALACCKRVASPLAKRLSKAKALLNISALYTEVGKPLAALASSKRALKLLQKDVESGGSDSNFARDVASSVVVAFYNIGAAQEALGKKQETAEALKAGLTIGAKFLPKDSEVLAITRAALQDAESRSSPHLMTSAHFRALLNERKTALDLSEPSGGLSPHTKYYSESQLKILKAKQEKAKGAMFVSSDQYFEKRISRELGSPRPIPKPMLTTAVEDRELVNSLRSRRKVMKPCGADERGPIRIKEELFHLRVEALGVAQKNEVRMQSRSKTKEFKDTLTTLMQRASSNAAFVPPQRLFFKRSEGEAGDDIDDSLVPTATTRERKEELEKFMDDVKLDIDFLNALKHPDSKSARGIRVPMKETDSDLAKSTFRRVSTMKKKSAAFTYDEVQKLVQVVDRKKLQKEAAKPIQKIRSPMEFPYKDRRF